MIGYHPDHSFLKKIGISIDEESGRPEFDEETMETNVEGSLYRRCHRSGQQCK